MKEAAIMKKKIIFLLILFGITAIFQGCGQKETNIDIIAKDYPGIDGSTSSLPIVQEIYKAIFKPEIINGEKVWNELPQTASKTIESYILLIDGEVDLIIVPDPSEEVKKLAEEAMMLAGAKLPIKSKFVSRVDFELA